MARCIKYLLLTTLIAGSLHTRLPTLVVSLALPDTTSRRAVQPGNLMGSFSALVSAGLIESGRTGNWASVFNTARIAAITPGQAGYSTWQAVHESTV